MLDCKLHKNHLSKPPPASHENTKADYYSYKDAYESKIHKKRKQFLMFVYTLTLQTYAV